MPSDISEIHSRISFFERSYGGVSAHEQLKQARDSLARAQHICDQARDDSRISIDKLMRERRILHRTRRQVQVFLAENDLSDYVPEAEEVVEFIERRMNAVNESLRVLVQSLKPFKSDVRDKTKEVYQIRRVLAYIDALYAQISRPTSPRSVNNR